MSKPYTEAEFSEQITMDRNWRIREISDLKAAIRRSDAGLQKVLLRALITVSYAHWEGYARFSAKKYLEHIALRKFQYKDLSIQFLKNYFLPRLGALSSSKYSVHDRCILIDEILNSNDRRFSRANDDLINTKSNLNLDTILEICLICGVDGSYFSSKAAFIDIILLKRRNAIAHGEDTLVSVNELDSIVDDTISLIRNFGDLLENRVVLQTYKAA